MLRSDGGLPALVDFIARYRPAVLTGAGISTDSGIPDYRGPQARAPRRPIQYRPFVEDPAVRQRYWARSTVGWPRFSRKLPNPGHRAVAALQTAGFLRGLITQNVDRLHHRAASRRVVELHGALAEVRCLGCRARFEREEVQSSLLGLNPGFLGDAASAPDGDADLPDSAVRDFVVVDCPQCSGILKPDVVFFGENVPRPVVDAAWTAARSGGGLLVLGSSLTVFSGFRFVKRAAAEGTPVAIVNLGPTRGDPSATVRLDAPLGQVLPAVAEALGLRMPAAPGGGRLGRAG